MGNPKECFKPHAVLHSISGFGVGLIAVGLVPSLAESALIIGIIILVAAIITEFVMKGKKKK